MMRYLFSLSLALLLFPQHGPAADSKAELEKIRQQRVELGRIRAELEAQLGELGRSLKKTDVALVGARADYRRVAADVRRADQRLAVLKQQQGELKQRIRQLKLRIQSEVALAYRQADRSGRWLDMLFDSRVTDIPHRQYLLSRLVQQQQQDRVRLAESVEALKATRQSLQIQRAELETLRRAARKYQHGLEQAKAEKKSLWKKVKRDAGLQQQRDRQLARQEAALKQLIKGIGSTLLETDNIGDWHSMREQKGRLPWPIRGRIVIGFRSRPAPGRPRLAGVQLAPRQSAVQVKAIAAGQVRYADWFGGYGLMMIVDHGDGLMTVYAHNDALHKRTGDWVAEGDALADAGSTGWVQSTRLYFEVRDAGRPVNPKHWCRRKG